MNRIVISGVGMVSAYGLSFQDFKQGLKDQALKVQLKTDWTLEPIGPQYSFEAPAFNIKDYFDNIRAPKPLRYSQLAMMGCLDALQDSGLKDYDYVDDRVGLIVNTAYGASEANEAFLRTLLIKGPRRVSPFKFAQTVSNVCLGNVCRPFELRGPSSLLFAESSISYGIDLLQNNQADVIICGGVDALTEYVFGYYRHYNHLVNNGLSEEEAEVQAHYLADGRAQATQSRHTIGEAGAFVVLERLEHAQQRGADIYAEVLDYQSQFDAAYDAFVFERSTEVYEQSMRNLLTRQNIDTTAIGGVVGAAYSPWFYKEVEAPALKQVFGNHEIHYTSAKPAIGEVASAASQASMGLGALMLKEQCITGFIPHSDLYDQAENVQVSSGRIDKEALNYLLVNTVIDGGNTTSFLLKKYES